jgi:hypothetical protein
MKKKIVFLACLCTVFSFVVKAQDPVVTGSTFQSTSATTGTGSSHLKLYNGTATTTKTRWIVGIIGNETGLDSGSNFRIFRYNDAGSFVATSLAIERLSGLVEMPSGFRGPAGSGITGSDTGTANKSWLGFYDKNKFIRHGYVGIASASSDDNDVYVTSDISGVSLFPYDGLVNLKNATKNMINFGNVGNGAPTINTRSAGTKIILANAVNPATSNADYAIGTEFSSSATHGWFSVPTNQTVHYWSFYGGTVPVAKLDGMGNFSTVGSVVVGSTATQATLKVNGDITARKLKITQTGWPDYVFGVDYKLPSLQEINNYIKANHHLPNVPAAAEIEKNGLDVGEMQKTMMQKIEELTLHMIRLDEENRQLKAELEKLKSAH